MKKEKRNVQESFFFSFPKSGGWTHLAGCATLYFCSYKVQLKTDLRVSVCILLAPNVMAVIF
jgi:hypothetical protein